MRLLLNAAFSVLVWRCALAVVPSEAELEMAGQWRERIFGGDLTELPFSFVYDGKPFSPAEWRVSREPDRLSFVDPTGTIRCDCSITSYPDFPVVSWLLRFRNVSDRNSGILTAIKPMDFRIPVRSKSKTHVVHHMRGGMQSLEDYQQHATIISQVWWRDRRLVLDSAGGRACQRNWPYFNVETPDAAAGMIVAIGWNGSWKACFDAAGDDRVKLTAGQAECRFYLKPGEEVRVPRAVTLAYRRADRLEAQNVWRQWFLRHNAPRCDGRIVPWQTMVFGCDGNFGEDSYSAANMIRRIDEYAAHGIVPDYYWIDAGWYNWRHLWDEEDRKPHWRWTGDYSPDPQGFPKGPREVFDHAKGKGVKDGILWFEIERVVHSSEIVQKHRDWVYPVHFYRGYCINMGKRESWNWVYETVDSCLRREGSRYFRIDFNFDPGWIWRENDEKVEGPDRQGITEMKHVDGVYRLFDAILRAEPGRRIDNCSQGGCRNDVESLHYGLPLWKTDTTIPVDEQQMQMLGFAQWVPLFGAGELRSMDRWEIRSRMQPYFNLSAKNADFAVLNAELAIWKRHMAPYYVKDFYPLTRGDHLPDQWCAWEYVDSEAGKGFVQVFRRKDALSPSILIRPRGLDARATYVFEDVDTQEKVTIRGDGEFEVRCPPRTARIYAFQRQREGDR